MSPRAPKVASLVQRPRVAWPEAWRPVDRLLAQWVMAHGGSEALARWAGAVSAAEGEGHTALSIDEAARFGVDPATLGALDEASAAGWVGDGGTPTPFVLEGAARLYLWRYWQAERTVAQAVATLAKDALPVDGPAGAPSEADIDALFDGAGDGRDAAQREAVQRCADARLFVLTGGPGTGKTRTVLRMLLARQRASAQPLRVAVAAPTGKAAQRLVDALREGRSALGDGLAAAPWADALARLPTPQASTVHRLLDYRPTRQRYARDAAHPIDADIVVVDEASMLDLEALAALLEALKPGAALWLVGDADQLSPVGPGSALQDIGQALAAAPLVRLAHSFRAAPALDALNRALRDGDAAAAKALFHAHDALRLGALDDAAALDAALRRWSIALAAESRFAPLPDGAAAAREAAGQALGAMRRRQWLCATREGPGGSITVAARLDALLRRSARQASSEAAEPDGAYPGRRLLVTRNDPDSGLFNGDVGVVLADADGRLRAWFDGEDGPRALPLGALPAHEPAFAMSVHKSQGSEYDEVEVLLPSDPMHRVLSRELLYTAASRARRGLSLWAAPAVLEACLAQPVRRMGGLHARLREAMAR
jgi:exodeoxyribonuclease V alpha subunit